MSCCCLRWTAPPSTHTHAPPSWVKHWTILTAGITAQSRRMCVYAVVGGGVGGEEWRRSWGRELGAPAAACTVRSSEGVGLAVERRAGGGEMRVRGRARKSLAGSPALSFTPNQALVWAWNAFVFQNIIIASSDSSRGNPSSLIHRRGGGGGRREGEDTGGDSAGVVGVLKVKLTFISPNWLTHSLSPEPLFPFPPPPAILHSTLLSNWMKAKQWNCLFVSTSQAYAHSDQLNLAHLL